MATMNVETKKRQPCLAPGLWALPRVSLWRGTEIAPARFSGDFPIEMALDLLVAPPSLV
jgi:hypothetical protein